MKAIYEYSIKRRRVLCDIATEPVKNSNNIVKIARQLCYQSEDMWKEKTVAFFLDNSGKVIGFATVGLGTQRACPFDIREIAQLALSQMAERVILMHNHPSNNVHPSTADIKTTESLKKALDLFDISLTDHIIIGEDSYFSFSSESETKE